ncbi:TetR/AcrR family transcriptional regulator [Streptomyces yaizuensis]|uniref:TetR/AcrR family transcriptional regulator helix-turn-helix transcriptional regulator n=1 Tax=Streptomyces yaizuensis TaxID=2989713 RepID=A0ABQ5P275_9ACTN|nr:helix-turn-helix domain-containing protein [Streptomyces sp. YSPA8]GLF96321.1 TetR/AcrR family transcriptional regulator; helix-turn-helix transcriptional regulator [Streptomyces sp. YSPA8]
MTVDREQVLRAAAALLSRKATATMGEVAQAAGIGRATLHRHFAGRDALVRALEELGLRELEAAVAAAGPEEGDPVAALRRLVAATAPVAPLLTFLITENQLFEGEEQMNEGWDRVDAIICALFRRGQEEGVFRVDLTATWLTDALYGLISAGAWAVQAGRVATKDYPYMIAELVLGGCTRRSVEV